MSISAVSRAFAYNTGSPVSGSVQVGNLTVGQSHPDLETGLVWVNGPNENQSYIIANSGSPRNIEGGGGSTNVSFMRSADFTDESFISLAEYVSDEIAGNPQTFSTAVDACSWLSSNGFWTSYYIPVLSLEASTYSGSGPWVDSISGRQFTLYNNPVWSSNNGGYFNFNAAAGQYAECDNLLPSLNIWTVEVWHYYDGTNVGSAPCIVTEVYVGTHLNYSLGNNVGWLSAGFFDGTWEITPYYELGPGNWYHIVGTYDGTNITLYINGYSVGSTEYVGNPTSSASGIRLMRRWDLPDYWGGNLAVVNIYDAALTPSQIQYKWNVGQTTYH